MVEGVGLLHHGRMTGPVQKKEFAIGDEPVELMCHIGGGDGVVEAPDEAGGLLYLRDLQAQVHALGRARYAHDADGLAGVVHGVIHIVHQVFAGRLGAKEGVLHPLLDEVVVAAGDVAGAHAALEEAGAAREGDAAHALGVPQGIHQGYVPPQGVAHQVQVRDVHVRHKLVYELGQALYTGAVHAAFVDGHERDNDPVVRRK